MPLHLEESILSRASVRPQQKGISKMRVSHVVTGVFDDPNLVSCAGLAPVLQLAERAGMQRLVGERVHLGKPGGVSAHLAISSLVAGMDGRRGRLDR